MNRCRFIKDRHRAGGMRRLCAVLEVACSASTSRRVRRAWRTAAAPADAQALTDGLGWLTETVRQRDGQEGITRSAQIVL
ncbi:hypothetical protein ACFV47_37980 [Streptomyces solisilvae]|uniref:hypothetical protein n=1 Tax=Streptomyces malaysiensis TaxID=92644 RepID=UPI0036A54BD8